MELTVEVDERSGFCYGVVKAIEKAEGYLTEKGNLYSLGSIVHNSSELDRLREKGLEIIDHKKMKDLRENVVLIRAHGEPPESYKTALENNLRLIDCTCPVVIKLQEKIKKEYARIKPLDGKLLIFGKRGHAEVNGLTGQVNGDALVVESIKDLDQVDFTKPVSIFSQTTKDPQEYSEICSVISRRICEAGGSPENFSHFNTICGQVSSRHPHLKKFAAGHSVIIFVTGRESSNGKILFDSCLSSNNRSYSIERPEEIKREWFRDGDSVGVCGATSTPMWLLREVARTISENI
ncbi:MAG: 4-hydroxy-3-methylbut-2-enyl diphosphate reductase [Bacteroidales bacterium]|nr:4-hydroxy-3-methylbut-2-enyl diphosphate reductase [Bacteroidales bacterium]MDD3990095.1 4-hydroxy-3-methylbut-2-enyl diphosphate reductase [Bacteroidales bacterium]MDD4638346.1 4-hydroxy-3-methylbut-2-enyl diphosphate reductase [Bacteroidales bacterium]